MNEHDLRTLMADYLDGLLNDEAAREAEARIARAPGLLAEVARLRAVLYRPYPVPPPAADLEERIARRARGRPRQWMLYAAVFAAGVLATLVVQLSSTRPPVTEPDPPQLERLDAPPAAAVIHRRIR
jgi:anti-sigma factor RsiW